MKDVFGVEAHSAYLFPVKNQNGYTFVRIQNPVWKELEEIFLTHSITTPITFLPPEMHLETLFLHTCAQNSIPATSGSVYDLAWTVAAIDAVQHDCIITNEAVAPFLMKKLKEKNTLKGITAVVFVESTAPNLVTHLSIHCYNLSHPLMTDS